MSESGSRNRFVDIFIDHVIAVMLSGTDISGTNGIFLKLKLEHLQGVTKKTRVLIANFCISAHFLTTLEKGLDKMKVG